MVGLYGPLFFFLQPCTSSNRPSKLSSLDVLLGKGAVPNGLWSEEVVRVREPTRQMSHWLLHFNHLCECECECWFHYSRLFKRVKDSRVIINLLNILIIDDMYSYSKNYVSQHPCQWRKKNFWSEIDWYLSNECVYSLS
jgi:hypothetical protein